MAEAVSPPNCKDSDAFMPNNRLLIQVVPQLKPAACGVSDHAISLAHELEAGFGIDTAFVVLNSTEPCDSSFPKVYCKPAQLVEACNSLSKGQPGALLIHYSGYGYSPDGAPFSLAEAIKQARRNRQFRIGAYIHELYANGRPWTSAFWYSHRQRQVVRRIARECDMIATNLNSQADWIDREIGEGGDTPIQRLPVFSNVGESVEIQGMRARRPAMTVIGLPHTRQESYKRLARLGNLLSGLGIEEIVDIGSECNAPTTLSGIPVRRVGVLAAADLGNMLAKSMFGFVPYSWFSLAKSGIFAGLCAHGAIPVIAESFAKEVDGLTDGIQMISPRTAKAAASAGLERCSREAWNWYSRHRLSVHAATYSRLLVRSATGAGPEVFASFNAVGS